MAGVNYLAFDFGATSGRTILGTLGDKLELRELTRFPNRQIRALGTTYWDFLDLFEQIKQGLVCAAGEGRAIRGIAVDTWGVDFGLLASDGSLLGNPVSYRDPRTDGMMEKVFARIARDRIYRLTGIQFMQLNTLYQLFALAQSRSPQLEAAETLLFMPDLFNYFLTGEKRTEYTIASTSQLLNAQKRSWEREILTALDVPHSILTPIVRPGTVVGPLLDDLAKETGLGRVEVIAGAAHDTAAAVAATPMQSPGAAYLSSGTWSLLGVETAEPVITAESLHRNFTNEGGVNGTVRFLRNAMGMWLLEGCKSSWERQGGKYSYPELVALAEKAEPFRSIVDPDADLFIHPEEMPAAIDEFCRRTGQPVPDSIGAFVRCVFESLALKYRFIVEGIEAMRPIPIDVLHIVGGGSQNELLNRFTADALGIPVVAGPIEATAIGNIMVQAVATGQLASIAEGRELVARSFPMKTVESRDTAQWEEQYQRIRPMFVQGLGG